MIESYKDLIVWQKAMELAEAVYGLCNKLPASKAYALTKQLHRAVVSVPSNIAEGCARDSTAEYIRFISVARGSLAEVETQILLAIRLRYLRAEDAQKTLVIRDEVSKMLTSLRRRLVQKLKEKGKK